MTYILINKHNQSDNHHSDTMMESRNSPYPEQSLNIRTYSIQQYASTSHYVTACRFKQTHYLTLVYEMKSACNTATAPLT